jgi:hypothetical protein
VVELQAHGGGANGWYFEHAFIDDVAFVAAAVRRK